MIKLIIVDDHPIFRRGLMSIVAFQADVEVIAESDGSDLIELCKEFEPDIISLDINLPGECDGFDLAKQVKTLPGDIKIIFVSMFNSMSYIRNSFKSGASGHIAKEAAVESFIKAIRVVRGGGLFFPREVFYQKVDCDEDKTGQLSFHLLTKREKEVARLFVDGLGYKEIAGKMDVSSKTIEAHRMKILKKTGCKNIQQFVIRGLKDGVF